MLEPHDRPWGAYSLRPRCLARGRYTRACWHETTDVLVLLTTRAGARHPVVGVADDSRMTDTTQIDV